MADNEPNGEVSRVTHLSFVFNRMRANPQLCCQTPPVITSTVQLSRIRIAPRKDLWKEAWEKLGAKKETEEAVTRFDAILNSYATLPAEATTQEKMSSIIKDKVKVMEDKQWKFQFGEKSIKVGDQAKKIVEAISVVKDLESSIASMDPVHAGIPWAGVCILLPVCC